MTQKKRIALSMRHPDEFRESAEATLGDDLVRWRAEEERERNPEAGQEMKDGTIFAGVDPETGRKIFSASQDECIRLDFNAAARYVQALSVQRYLGYDDWELPSRSALKVLYDNRHKGALAGMMREELERSSFYWSAAPYDNVNAYGRLFSDGLEDYVYKGIEGSVRVVRSPQEPSA